MVLFPMEGQVMVGYNHKKFVIDINIDELDLQIPSLNDNFSARIFKISFA
jgi:hypothetical protein